MGTGIKSLANAAALLVCVLLTAALVLPAIAQQRSQARQSACAYNLKRIGFAFHNYHSVYKQLPPGCGGTTDGDSPESSNHGRIGPLVALLPFVEQQRLWEVITKPYTNPESNQMFPKMGPVPWYDSSVYKPWSQAPSVYACPDSPHSAPAVAQQIVYTLHNAGVGRGVMTNYVACYGDGTFNVGTPDDGSAESSKPSLANKRGLFQAGRAMKFRDCLDGLASTLMYSETRSSVDGKPDTGVVKSVVGLSKNPSLCLNAAKGDKMEWWPFGRGSRWCDGELALTGFQTVLPPNSPSCTSENGIHDAIASASSYHPDGVHTLFADGAVIFITDTIDTGDSSAPGVSMAKGYGIPGSESPYGLWGAFGTRAARETMETLILRGTVRDTASAEDNKKTSGSLSMLTGSFSQWTSKEGDISLHAKLVRIIDKKTIELEDTDGVIHQVPLNALSDRDMIRAVTSELLNKKKIQQ